MRRRYSRPKGTPRSAGVNSGMSILLAMLPLIIIFMFLSSVIVRIIFIVGPIVFVTVRYINTRLNK